MRRTLRLISWIAAHLAAANAWAADDARDAAGDWVFTVPYTSAGSVFGFAQDSHGVIWVGTNNGVERWNGFETAWIGPTAMRTAISETFQIAPTQGGGVWLGFGGSAAACASSVPCPGEWPSQPGLIQMVAGRPLRVTVGSDGVNQPVWALGAQGKTLWIGTPAGLFRRDESRTVRLTEGLSDPFITAIAVTRAGDVWAGTRSGMQRLRKGLDHFDAPVGTELIVDVIEAPDGTVWAATRTGLLQVSRHAPRRLLDQADGLPAADVRAIAIDADGAVWVATWAGLARIDGDRVTVVKEIGLRDTRLLSIGTDDERGVWIGSRSGGLARGFAAPVRGLGPREGLPFDVAIAVAAAPDGRLWASGPGGPLAIVDQGRATAVPTPEALRESPSRTLAIDRSGRVFVGTEGEGLWMASSDPSSQVAPVAGVDERHITSLLVAPDDTLIVAGHAGTVALYTIDPADTGSIRLAARQTFTSGDGLCPGEVTALAADARGTIWMGSSHGRIGVIESGRARCLDVKVDGSTASVGPFISSLAIEADGTVWASRWGGLIRIRIGHAEIPARTTAFEKELSCNAIATLVLDQRGHLWTACDGGVARLDLAELRTAQPGRGIPLHPLRFGRAAGLPSLEANFRRRPAAALGADRRLWVATSEGLASIADPDDFVYPAPPRITAIDVLVDGRPLPRNEPISFGRDASVTLRLDVVALTLPELVRFQVETAPSRRVLKEDFATRPEVRLNALPPDRYRVNVHAASPYGTWALSPATIALRVTPRLTERPLLWLGLAVLVTLAALATQRFRHARVAAQAAAVQDERKRLARDLHDHLGQGFASIGFHLGALAEQLASTPGDAAATLERTRGVVRRAHDEARRTIWRLRAPDVLGVTLEAGLRALASETIAGTGRIELTIASCPRPLDARVDGELLQVAREAVTNARVHSGAARILIDLRRVGHDLRLRISDSGVGFHPDPVAAAQAGHFGLLGMHERVRRLGGSLAIDSTPGHGAVVEAKIPLSPAA